MVARTVTALTRLLDVVSLIATDHRIQIVFTVDDERPAIFEAGATALLDELAPRRISWTQARKTRFDLILSASENDGLSDLDGPILLLPHGLAFQKYYPGSTVVAGLDPARLPHTGAVTVGLPHPAQHPPAGAPAAVLGDPAWGRMLAGRHRRNAYRAAFGATGRRLIVLASTWGPDSLLGACPDLPGLLAGQLPMDEYRVVAVLHPGVWAEHGPWQVRAWLSPAAGLRVLEPDTSWQAALTAADCVLADHGSLAGYAALTGVPVLLGPRPSDTTVPGSVADRLGERCARLDPYADLREQIDVAIRGHVPDAYRPLLAGAVAEPETTAARLRAWLYRTMELSEPAVPAEFPPPPVPAAASRPVGAWVAGVQRDGDQVTIIRFPALGAVHEELAYRHVVARLEHATATQVAGAAILGVDTAPEEDLFRQWPHATLIAAAERNECRVWTPGGEEVLLRADSAVIDPWALASWAYWRVRRGEPLTGTARLRIGRRPVTIRVSPG
ncbi:hypothetical protein GCM10010168_09090 [Actinoplanes ianthinogenes]|uniref:Uncharacterized protein n=1 Tax=Actinoplanes ianthinogenes TaxID=122358 RepID=A0ABM7LY04_9ACTN|nr:hypothetical protein [Actinoplanes ianthinogenes]BCJ44096.1 hypothetical protein Aiant_47530 [Actinoplanes ianthinogenes]GGQ95777.1 hypothetical protein GCM10010168_09090 [Actinoplanes ianthinogenes]